MLKWRLVSAAALIGGILLLTWLDFHYHHSLGNPGIILAPLLVVAIVAGAAELLSLFAAQNLHPAAPPVYAGVLLIILAALAPLARQYYLTGSPLEKLGGPLAALAVATTLVFLFEMRRFDHPGGVMIHVSLAVFVFVYLGVFGSFLAALRMFQSNEWGLTALLSLIAVVKASDAGAYFVGRAVGRTKITPKLSPGKTLEGFVGGLASALVASYLMLVVIGPRLTETSPPDWWRWVVYGLILAVAGMLGDLAESLLKRDMQRKDSGTLIPGMGGVLDVMDSILMAAPPAFLCWALGLVGPLAG